MTVRRQTRLMLTALVALGFSTGQMALARETDNSRTRVAPPPPLEGLGAAEALNADINARNAEAAARDREADAEYARKQREYEAKTRADAAAYAKALAAYEARKAAIERQHQADLAAWRARVEACKAGDKTACAPG